MIEYRKHDSSWKCGSGRVIVFFRRTHHSRHRKKTDPAENQMRRCVEPLFSDGSLQIARIFRKVILRKVQSGTERSGGKFFRFIFRKYSFVQSKFFEVGFHCGDSADAKFFDQYIDHIRREEGRQGGAEVDIFNSQ